MNEIFVGTGKAFWYLARQPWFLAMVGLILLANGANEFFERFTAGLPLFKGNSTLMLWDGFFLMQLAYAEAGLVENY